MIYDLEIKRIYRKYWCLWAFHKILSLVWGIITLLADFLCWQASITLFSHIYDSEVQHKSVLHSCGINAKDFLFKIHLTSIRQISIISQSIHSMIPASHHIHILYFLQCSSQCFNKCINVWLLLLLSCLSCVWLCVTPKTAAHQAPLSLRFSRQEHWSGLPLLGWYKSNYGFALLNFAIWYWNAFLNVVILYIILKYISCFIFFTSELLLDVTLYVFLDYGNNVRQKKKKENSSEFFNQLQNGL